MQIAPRVKNKNTIWSATLKPRVTDTVISGGLYYVNIAGYNSDLTDTNAWLPAGSTGQSSALEINKTSADITGSDPFFSIDLSAEAIAAFPSGLAVYKDVNGDDNWINVSPVDYDPVGKILRGMDNPADFPDEKIKILVS
jgi:hypothetical protein